MKTISISNQKGGCGKTTTAINLAGALANLGKHVLVIDLDPQSHATFGLGVTNQAADISIYNAMTDIGEKRRALSDCIVHVSDKLDLVPSNILLSTLEQELKDKDDAVSRLYEVLRDSHLTYDYAVIDCPPSLGFLTFNSLRAAELVIVPIDMSAFSLMGVGKLLGMLELIKIKISHAPRVKALATIFDKRTKYSQTMLDEIKTFFKDQLLETVVRINVALKKAAFAGIPVVQLDDKSNGALDHTALAKEVLRLEGDIEFEKALAEVTEKEEEAIKIAPRDKVVFVHATVQTTAEVNAGPSRISTSRIPDGAVSASPRGVAVSTQTSSPEAVFSLDMPQAKDVYVVGGFNHWKINETSRLSTDGTGKWEKRLALSPGTYRYKFVVDGEWILDTHNAEKEQNPFGTFDSVITIP